MKSNVFFTTAVHLQSWSPIQAINDPTQLHNQDEAIQKMHRFCHEIYDVPITWLTSWGSLQKYKDTLIPFCNNYSDEVAILEYGIYPSMVLGDDPSAYQGWVEEAGLVRPHEFQSREVELANTKSWRDMTYGNKKLVFLI